MKGRLSAQERCVRPKVSVAMITYNHEPFIAEAIESVLMQETRFEVELVIGEDCSTDKTRSIVEAYAARHPEVIRLILPDGNRGMQENLRSVLEACRGEYVALLEGDDYWCSECKLQEQAEVLDRDASVGLVFHQATTVTGKLSRPYRASTVDGRTFDLEDFASLRLGPVPTASVMVRGVVVANLPGWFTSLPFGDLSIIGLAAEAGGLRFLDRCWAVYRVHEGGAAGQMLFADVRGHLERNLRFEDGQGTLFRHMRRRNPTLAEQWGRSISVLELNAAWAARLLSRPGRSLRHAWRALSGHPASTLRSSTFWKTLVLASLPLVDRRRASHVRGLGLDLEGRRRVAGLAGDAERSVPPAGSRR